MQIHVAAGVERLLEPAAGGKALDHLVDDPLVSFSIFFGAGDLGEEIVLGGCGLVRWFRAASPRRGG